MEILFVVGIFLGILGSVMMNIGKGVQKQHVGIFLQGRHMFDKAHRRLGTRWLLGVGLCTVSALPYTVGLKLSESPSTIAAMTGVGIIGLAIYATRVIGEKLGAMDAAGIALIIIGTSALGFAGAANGTAVRVFENVTMIKSVGVLFIATSAACVMTKFLPRTHGVVWGIASGVGTGLALFLGDAALVRSGGSLIGQLSNPFPYIAVVFGILANVAAQIGYVKAKALVVVPATNAAIILSPYFLEGAVYGRFPSLLLFAFMLVIVAGVIILSTGPAAKASG
jgi:hypothetical protein